MDYGAHILTIFCIYALLAIAQDLLAGHLGIIAICLAAFATIGAYAAALVGLGMAWPVYLTLSSGFIVAVAFSLPLALPVLRLRDDYLVIATFGFQIIVTDTAKNWSFLTGGSLGITGIPPARIGDYNIQPGLPFLALALLVASTVFLTAARIRLSPFGEVLRTIREDELQAQALGKNVFAAKVSLFVFCAGICGVSGALYAHYIAYIHPSSFTVAESITIVSMVAIGGAGSRWGALLGAASLILIQEGVRFVGLPSATGGKVRQLSYGLALIVIMMVRPGGLFGGYDFEARR